MRVGDVVPVVSASVLLGRFSRITLAGGDHRVVPSYTPTGLSVRVLSAG